MPDTLTSPRVTNNLQGRLLSYELPHRAHTIQVYPIESSNGSTVILYGHENGVKIVWRGGRPFKATSEPGAVADSEKANGTGHAIVLLDSDNEGEASKVFRDKEEFADELEELDPSQPYPGILQVLDLFLGTDVIHLAVLPSSISKISGAALRTLDPLKNTIVFTVACADDSLRLITLPLAPPSPAAKSRPEFRADFTVANAGNGKWGEKIVILNGHRKSSDGVSMTVDVSDTQKPQFMVASHSREVNGTLVLFRIPIKTPNPFAEPFRTVHLSSPARSISFNPSLSKHHASLLLVAESTGVCRIFDYNLQIKPAEETEMATPEQGSWVLSLYAGFQTPKPDSLQNGAHAGFGRKTLIDGQWVSDGRAVMILLNDGEWAIWDIEGVGPGASQGLLSRSGIKGGSKSEYSLTGYIDAVTKSCTSGPPQITQSKFAPMTPGTRKSVDPFGGRAPGAFVHGQISVVEVKEAAPTAQPEESVLFWLGDTYAFIPSLSKFWSAHYSKAGGGSLFGSTAARMVKLEGIDLQGERCSGVTQIPKRSANSSDLIILGEHRFVILDTTKEEKKEKHKPSSRFALVEKPANDSAMDIDGDLTVDGIEAALERMERGNGAKRKIF